MIRKCSAFLIALMPLCVMASTDTHTRVTGAGIHGNGRFTVLLENVIDEAGCPMNRIDIMPSHPNYKELVALGMAAAAKKSVVQVKTGLCTAGFKAPTLNLDESSWFLMKE